MYKNEHFDQYLFVASDTSILAYVILHCKQLFFKVGSPISGLRLLNCVVRLLIVWGVVSALNVTATTTPTILTLGQGLRFFLLQHLRWHCAKQITSNIYTQLYNLSKNAHLRRQI